MDLSRTHVTDTSLKQIGLQFPNIRSLILSECHDISDNGLEELLLCLNSNLQLLDLSECVQLSDEVIKQFVFCFSKLEQLYLSQTKLTEQSWVDIKSRLTDLEKFDIRYTEAFESII